MPTAKVPPFLGTGDATASVSASGEKAMETSPDASMEPRSFPVWVSQRRTLSNPSCRNVTTRLSGEYRITRNVFSSHNWPSSFASSLLDRRLRIVTGPLARAETARSPNGEILRMASDRKRIGSDSLVKSQCVTSTLRSPAFEREATESDRLSCAKLNREA